MVRSGEEKCGMGRRKVGWEEKSGMGRRNERVGWRKRGLGGVGRKWRRLM